MRKLSLLLVLVLVSVSFGELLPAGIPQGTVTVDGDLNDWTGADWTAMDSIVANYGSGGSGYDGTTGNIAMQWDDTTNMVYVAIQYTDTDRNYTTIGGSGSWRKMDLINIYWDGANSNANPYYNDSYALAQHFMITSDGSGTGAYVHFGDYSAAAASDYGGAKWAITGDDIVLEIGLKPWAYRPTASHDLVAGGNVGLEAIISDRDDIANDNNLTWWSHQGSGWSSSNAGVFKDSTLLPEPCTMVLLGIGGASLLRRKKT